MDPLQAILEPRRVRVTLIPGSTLVKVRRIVTGLRHDDERDDDRSHRRVSIMSSLDAG